MAVSETLYTQRVLQLATSLARWPWDDTLPRTASARSRSCGSTLDLAARVDDSGNITALALRSRACAIGQASAAIFADAAMGKDRAAILQARQALVAWLAGDAALPDWPGLDAIAAAQAYPGRHGAMLLAWDAASELLCETELPR